MFTKIFVILAAGVFSLFAILVPLTTYAANDFSYNSISNNTVLGVSSTPSTNGVVGTISNIANALILIVAAISVIFIVYGAFIWMTKGQKEGQAIVQNAVIGLIVAVVSFFIVQLGVGAANQINSTKIGN